MKSFRMKCRAVLACVLCLNTALPVYAEEPDAPVPSPVTETEEAAAPESSADAETEERTPEEALQETDDPAEESDDEITEPEETEEPAAPEESEDSEDVPDEVPKQTEDIPEETPQAQTEEPASEEGTAYADRLIVLGGEIRESDHVISSYEDMTLLGFTTPEALQEGFAWYQAHSVHTEIDGVVLAAEEEGITDAPNEISEENNPIDQLQELLTDEADKPKKQAVRIALIDTGAKAGCENIISAVSLLGDDPGDDNGHGSRMAEYILAENPDAEIISVKALDANGKGTMSSVFAAMEYAMEQNVDLIALCMSACVSAENRVIADEIEKAAERGIRTVGAAGNSGLNVKYFIPGGSDAAVIAGSCDSAGTKRDFSNYGDTVDYLVVSDSTSQAAAVLCGILSKNTEDPSGDPRVFSTAPSQETDPPAEPDPDDSFYSQCNAFFYGDAYYWEVPAGETTTANAVLIPGQQQATLSSKTASANGYNVQFGNVADDTFSPGHGYAVFASTHKESAVSSWGGGVHITDYRGNYEAWGTSFDSVRSFSISAKSIPNLRYLGVIVSQNSTAKPGAAQVSSLSKATTANVKLGEEDATYWEDVPGVNPDYWKGWDNTSSGDEYSSFRVDFYYQSVKQKYNLTVKYLEEGTEKQLAAPYGPKQILQDDPYSVPSAKPDGYELVNPKEAVISGTMPNHDVTVTVYYRRVYKITTSVINGMITLNNQMEKDGTVGDATWNAKGAVTSIRPGENRTIKYENRPGYLIDYVKVDGTYAEPKDYPKTVRNLQLIYAAGAMLFASTPGVIADHLGSYIPVYAIFAISLAGTAVCLIAAYRLRK